MNELHLQDKFLIPFFRDSLGFQEVKANTVTQSLISDSDYDYDYDYEFIIKVQIGKLAVKYLNAYYINPYLKVKLSYHILRTIVKKIYFTILLDTQSLSPVLKKYFGYSRFIISQIQSLSVRSYANEKNLYRNAGMRHGRPDVHPLRAARRAAGHRGRRHPGTS